MFVVASLTDPIVEFAVDVVDAMGLPGIFLLMVAESACSWVLVSAPIWVAVNSPASVAERPAI